MEKKIKEDRSAQSLVMMMITTITITMNLTITVNKEKTIKKKNYNNSLSLFLSLSARNTTQREGDKGQGKRPTTHVPLTSSGHPWE